MESCTVPVRPLKCQIQLTAESGDSELQLPVADFQNHSKQNFAMEFGMTFNFASPRRQLQSHF